MHGGMLLANGIGLVTKYVHVTLHLKASGRILLTQLSFKFALIHWLEEHQERFNMYPAPIEVWSPPSGVLSSFVPLASIVSRVAVMKDNNSETLVIIPL